MKTRFLVLGLATLSAAFAVPALGQSRAEEDRWRAAQRRYDEERNIYEREQQRYDEAKRRDEEIRYDRNYDDRNYDPVRDYRADSRYAERPMTAQDQVWQGSDGRYYCRRTDGTTGLVVGAGVGALVGRGIDGGNSRATGTIVGGVLGALLGREVERSADMSCR
jgi:hypothetical protein